jgi:hypothetical protein
MQVDYCDLCLLPMKENDCYMLSIASAKDRNYTTMEEYNACMDKLLKGIKYVCPTCKYIFDKIFELRMQNLSQLSNELLGIYNLPPKENKDEKDKK